MRTYYSMADVCPVFIPVCLANRSKEEIIGFLQLNFSTEFVILDFLTGFLL